MSIFGEFSYYYTIGVCDVLTMGLDSTLSSGNFFLYSCCILARYVFKTPEWPGYSAESTLTVPMTSERTWISGGIFSVQYLLCYTVNWTSLKPFQKCVHHYSISMRLGLHFSNFFDQLWICTGGPKDMNFKLLRAECRQKFTSWDWITYTGELRMIYVTTSTSWHSNMSPASSDGGSIRSIERNGVSLINWLFMFNLSPGHR